MAALKVLAFALVITAPSALAQSKPSLFAGFDMASEPVLNDPHDLTMGPDGMLYVADKLGHRVVVMDPETLEIAWEFGGGQLLNVRDVSFGPDGLAYLAVSGLSRVEVFQIEGQSAQRVGVIEGVSNTEGAVAHSNGRVYAMASGTGDLVAFETGKPIAAAGGMFGAHDVAAAPDGSLWVADNRARRLVNFDADLNFIRDLSGSAFGFLGPRYLDVDELGRLIVADQDGHRVLLIDPDGGQGGEVLGVIGDGTPGEGPLKFDDPEGALAVGSRYFFSDSDNNRIVRYSVVLN